MDERIITVVPAYNEEESIEDTLRALNNQTLPPEGVVVVDNGSTDATPDIVEGYKKRFRNSDLHLIMEPEKGTGNASRAGFDYAINQLGATVVSRTDADTVPFANWNEVISKYAATHPEKQLLAGATYPKKDKFFKPVDSILIPLVRPFSGLALNDVHAYKYAAGHNMAVRPFAYEKVGGFTRSAIDRIDEDVELSKAIQEEFSHKSLAYVHRMGVETSMRRLRSIGYTGILPYFARRDEKETSTRRHELTGGLIDVR